MCRWGSAFGFNEERHEHTVRLDRQAVVHCHVERIVSSKLRLPCRMVKQALERLDRPDRDDVAMGYTRCVDDLQAGSARPPASNGADPRQTLMCMYGVGGGGRDDE